MGGIRTQMINASVETRTEPEGDIGGAHFSKSRCRTNFTRFGELDVGQTQVPGGGSAELDGTEMEGAGIGGYEGNIGVATDEAGRVSVPGLFEHEMAPETSEEIVTKAWIVLLKMFEKFVLNCQVCSHP